uniref:EGF-like domain-containing protein n=1 Tax=Rhabditophanes sp. KR3021 TaxID=114890 RepID=A0AC35TZ85_9BILA
MALYLFKFLQILLLSLYANINLVTGECIACHLLAETFKIGMEATVKGNFAGGNTDWEERKLGKFKTSETRLLEIMEFVCQKSNLKDNKEYAAQKDVEFKCHSIVENNEEQIEEWFFNHQLDQPDLQQYLCHDVLKLCCSKGHFGKDCGPCPGLLDDGKVCFGRGYCSGDETRKGTGKCSCDSGYVGSQCSNCAAHFYPTQKNATFIECNKCFDGCAKGCTGEGAKSCIACRSGYEMKDSECVDVNECLLSNQCTKSYQVCKNSIGSFECVCTTGYVFNSKLDKCEVDVAVTMKCVAFICLLLCIVAVSSKKPFFDTTKKKLNALWNLQMMAECRLGYSALVYNNYGCWCGVGGAGKAMDQIDACCEKHDKCYDAAIDTHKCMDVPIEYVDDYSWKCLDHEPMCSESSTGCAKELCACDKAVVDCWHQQPKPNAKVHCDHPHQF